MSTKKDTKDALALFISGILFTAVYAAMIITVIALLAMQYTSSGIGIGLLAIALIVFMKRQYHFLELRYWHYSQCRDRYKSILKRCTCDGACKGCG